MTYVFSLSDMMLDQIWVAVVVFSLVVQQSSDAKEKIFLLVRLSHTPEVHLDQA